MADWTVVFEDPVTGDARTLTSTRPLRQDEIGGAARERWGRDAKILHRDPYPGTPRAIREMVARKPEGGMEPPNLPMAEGPQHPDWGKITGEGLGFGASLYPALKGPALLGKLLGPAVRQQSPRLLRFLGLSGGGAVAPSVQAVVAGRPEDALDPQEAALGFGFGASASAAHSAAGAWRRQGKGAANRIGETMAGELEAVAGPQVPPMKGLKTGGHLADWATRQTGLRDLYQMFQKAKDAVSAHLPPGATLHVPSLSDEALTFENALKGLAAKGTIARREGASASTQAGRDAYWGARDELERELIRRGVPQQVAEDFFTMRGQYAMGKGYQALLPKGLNQRTLNPQGLQEALQNPKFTRALEKAFGEGRDPQEFNRLLDVLLRGKKDPRTGTYAVREADIPPAETITKALRYYLIHQPGNAPVPVTGRAGFAAPHGSLFTRFVHGPGRRPLEAGGTTESILALLARLGEKLVAPTPSGG